MIGLISAMEEEVLLFRERAEIAETVRQAGIDFHVGAQGPKLIEINTNAGGAMINAAAGWRHPDCCNERNPGLRIPASREQLEAEFMAMFRQEWRRARGDRPLKTVAIVDDHPAQQFLLPEFRLFADLFAAHGLDALVADAAELEFSGGRLRAGGRDIDLVYNRVTDFYFDEPAHRALREAYANDAAVITPYALLIPVFGMGASAIVLGEPVTWWKIASGIMVLGGIMVIIYKGKK